MYQIKKFSKAQLDKLPAEVRAEYDEIKTDSENFSDSLYKEYKEMDEELFEIMQMIVGKPEASIPKSTTPKKKAKGVPSPPAPKAKRKRRKLSYKNSLPLDALHAHGDVYELAVLKGTCRQVGIVLDSDTDIYTKGDVHAKAKRGELVSMVEVDKDVFRQFNIIGNMGDKCVFTHFIKPDGTKEPYDCDDKKVETVKSCDTKEEKKTTEKKPTTKPTEQKPTVKKTEPKGDNKKDDPCPPTPCDDDKPKPSPKKVAERKRKKETVSLTRFLHHSSADAYMGNADMIVAKVIRRKDMRMVLVMAPYKATRTGLKADMSKAEYHLFSDDGDGKLRKTEKPTGEYSVIDAKAEALSEGETPKSKLLDTVYAKDGAIDLCVKVEKELQQCRTESCSVEEKAYYQGLQKQCSDKAGQQLFFQEMRKEFDQVFQAQKRGESFWDAYLRLKADKDKKAEKETEEVKKK